MSYSILIIEILVVLLISAYLLFLYGNWRKQHALVTVSVLIAWFFSMSIIVVLPIDISSTAYNQCILDAKLNNVTANATIFCKLPYSYVPQHGLQYIWRILYWTSQFLTWCVLPIMQSYTVAGGFTVLRKLRMALIDNAIYYGLYLILVLIFGLYIIWRPDVQLDFFYIKVIAITASNTWGLCLLIPLLGYGLVEVPHSLWRNSRHGYSLKIGYFHLAKLAQEKLEAEEELEDLVKVIKAVQNYNRTQAQWKILLEHIWNLEDIEMNEISYNHHFKHSFSRQQKYCENCLSSIWWYWYCTLQRPLLKILSFMLIVFSVLLVWSELTFFSINPLLSIHAVIADTLHSHYDYIAMEIFSLLSIAYLCVCSYYTVFQIRILNLYYLASPHLTDSYSLMFSGKLTAPLCLNYLGLIHLDSHITQQTSIVETAYTYIMGHLDVLPFISNGFNLYFPSAIFALCISTIFRLGEKILSYCGFQQFLTDEMTSELVEEGHELSLIEKRKRIRDEQLGINYFACHKKRKLSYSEMSVDSVHMQLLPNAAVSYDDFPPQRMFDDV